MSDIKFNSPSCMKCQLPFKRRYSGTELVLNFIKYFSFDEIQNTCEVCLQKQLKVIKLEELKNEIIS